MRPDNNKATGMAGQYFRRLTLVFAAQTNPAFGGRDLEVMLDVDSGNGRDVVARLTNRKNLEAIMAATAAASIVQP